MKPTSAHVADYLRQVTDHPLAGLRAGVADALDGASPTRLDEEVAAILDGDSEALKLHLDSQLWIWLACDDEILIRCGELLQEAISKGWDEAAAKL